MKDKTEGITRVNDITVDWVKANFDLDEERRTTKKETFANRTDYMEGVSSSEAMTLDDFVAAVNRWLDVEFEEDEEGKLRNGRRMIRVRDQDTTDYYDCGTSSVIIHEAFIEYDVEETDAEVITRIKNREKQKVRRRNEAAKKVKAEEKKVAEEKKLLKQLMKKYKDEL